jgi:hypothetical protein
MSRCARTSGAHRGTPGHTGAHRPAGVGCELVRISAGHQSAAICTPGAPERCDRTGRTEALAGGER